jgi:hypothetical protein
VTVPFTISWLPPTDPSGIVAYNWQVSGSSTFADGTVLMADSLNAPAASDTVSGLPNGTYFWRVQAVNGAFESGAWSLPRSFTVTGANAGQPGVATMNPPEGGTTAFHPMETIRFTWSAVPGADSYIIEFSTDPTFAAGPRTFRMDNLQEPRDGLAFADEGSYFTRVRAVNADRVAGNPSNVIAFSVRYDNPVGPPPAMVAPADGATVTLPVTFKWEHVPNPQPSGYEIEVSRNASFTDIEAHLPQLNGPEFTYLSLTSGTKFWRIRSHQGDSSPTTSAPTAWSPTRSFTIPNTPPQVSVQLFNTSPFSGQEVVGRVQLTTAAPPGGAVVSLESSNPAAAPVPASVTVDGESAIADFRFFMGQVTADTPVTITARYGDSTGTFSFVLHPPSLRNLIINPNSLTGGANGSGFVELNGRAPAGGAVVSLSSDSPLIHLPPTMTVEPNFAGGGFTYATDAVTAPTTATITATWKGASLQQQVTLVPQEQPSSVSLDPSTTTGTQGSTGRVARATATGRDAQFILSSSHPELVRMNQSVTIPAHAVAALFPVNTSPVTTRTLVTISASGGGVTQSAVLTLEPSAPPPPPPPPSSSPLPAPSLLSPGSDARFSPGQTINFDWSDVSGAASYTIQASTSSAFSSTVLNQTVTTSRYSTSSLRAADMYWRARANDSSGNPGTWSGSRRFRVKN